ncbi:MAG TPA: sulfide/dihydroorotate dehydrogenase-like FAD/NAD-binding protein, partial [Solibacterales bacterium]|nr:sulfide/dihydroorotate dehydrogenase-like FAD/NAD-binding protein [Bryobacterales bacterium]
MNRVVAKRMLTPEIAMLVVEAPRIARRWKAGQFLIIRPTEDSERIPLTLVDGDAAAGTITIVVQAIGKTTRITAGLAAGDSLADVVGPLGEPASVEKIGRVLCAGGGVGVAELLPVAKAFRASGNHVTALCGARGQAQIILDEELRQACDDVQWATDDGSVGFHGNVVQLMKAWLPTQPGKPDAAHVIGPIPMMKFSAALTKEWGVKTYASLNPVMIDGTGMCGGCRVTVGDQVKFACVDGP